MKVSKKKSVFHHSFIFILIFSLIAAPFQSVASATELEELELENEASLVEVAKEQELPETSLEVEDSDTEVEENLLEIEIEEEQVESNNANEETVEENQANSIESEEENAVDEMSIQEDISYTVEFDDVTTTKDSITVSWKTNFEVQEDINLFINGELVTVPSHTTSYTFDGLIPGKEYYIDVETEYHEQDSDHYYYLSDRVWVTPYWTDEELVPVSIITILNDELSYDENIRIRGIDENNKGFNSDEGIHASGALLLPLGKFEVTLYNYEDPSIAQAETITIKEGVNYLNNPIQIKFELKEMNEAAEPFEYKISKVTESSFTLIWNSVSKITGFKLYAYSDNADEYHEVDAGTFKNDSNEFTLNGLQTNITYWVNFYTEYVHDLNKDYNFKVKTIGEDAQASKVNFENEKLDEAVAKGLGVYERNVTEADMKSLEGISIDKAELKTLDGLQHAVNLKSLHAYDNEISDISVLRDLKHLTDLTLGYNNLEDISALEELIELKHLNIQDNQLSNLDSLKGLTNLKELFLSYNQIKDISGLNNLKQLEWIYLKRNQISNIEPLSELTNVRYLQLGNNEINDISPLSKLNQLESLQLRNNQITSIDALANLTGLENLELGNNQIKDISALEKLNLLNDLVLYSNNITDISSLASLTNLEYLDLDDNQITDISALKSLTNLQYVYLSDNPITDISVLKELPNLQEVSLYGIENIDEETVQFLRNRGVEVRYYNNDDDDWNDWDPDDEDKELDPETVEELKKSFPVEKGFVVNEKGEITLDLTKQSNKEQMELTTEQTKMLIETKQSLVLDNGGVTTSIPASSFDNYDEPVTIEVKELERTPNSLSSTYDFTVKQGSRNISTFDEGVTLTFNVNAGLAKNPKNLKVFYFNEDTNKWENIGGTYNNGRVTAVTYHFSIFTVMEAADEDATSDEIVEIDDEVPTPGEEGTTPPGKGEDPTPGEGTPPGKDENTTPGEDDNTTPGGDAGTTPDDDVKNTFPAEKGFVVSDNGKNITLDLSKQSNKEQMQLTTEQLKMLIEKNQTLVLVNGGVTASIPASTFDNYEESVTIEIKELKRTPNSLSSTYDFTITQGSTKISKFKDGITLTFNVNADLAKKSANLKVFYLNEDTNKWEIIGGSYQNGQVTAVTNHFSIFTVFEIAADGEIVDFDNELPIPGGGSGNTPGGNAGSNPDGNTGTTPGGNTGATPSEDQGADDKDEIEESTVAPVNTSADQKEQTNSLPNTATNSYQTLLIGGLLLVAGIIVLAMKQRRRA
ncbi:hypothetical protein BTS2_1913 [Bacillus sp. TS-2]|nr:hypothetical protein BTS2_1913 [Bacillus sp. TS-2]